MARRLVRADRATRIAYVHHLARELQEHHTTLLAAGVAFRGFLALFSALVVATSALALAQPANEIIYQTRRLTLGLPLSAREVILEQVDAIVTADSGLRITFAVSLALALWVSASAVQGVMDGLTAVSGVPERRGWVRRRMQALGLTFAAIPFVGTCVAVITGFPVLFRGIGLEGSATLLALVAEIATLALMMFSALIVLYRVGPSHRPSSWRSTVPGAVVATIGWLLGTELFAQVVEGVGTYDARYGTVAGIAVLLLWLLLTSWSILFGATVNVTPIDGPRPPKDRRRSTSETRPDRPLGRRDDHTGHGDGVPDRPDDEVSRPAGTR